MKQLVNKFYECDNPDCRLRFPGSDGFPRWNRCPICRSSTHLVATSRLAGDAIASGKHQQLNHVEAILDNIRSAWNVGSILRTADGLGIRKIYLCGISPTPANSKVAKTALGAEQSVPWDSCANSVILVKELKQLGYHIWVLEDLPGAQELFQAGSNPGGAPVALVVGNEIAGVDPGIIELSDKVLAIPMLGTKQSYNVAVAFGIAASFLLHCQIFSQGSRSILPST
jgi:23S rRNA (guanosine2251-2'-O)-methyltransferase